MNYKIALVDKHDNILGFSGVGEAHSGRGKHHRGFSTLLFNSKNQVLLQRRKHRLFDGVWDLTAISHPLVEGGKTESYQEASDRALKKEMGIGHVEIRKVGAFNYFAKDGKNCENEYCAVLVGEWNRLYRANPDEVYESKWVNFAEFTSDVAKNPKKYAPWAVLAVPFVEKGDSEFNNLLGKFLGEFEPYFESYFKNKKKIVSKYPKLIEDFYADLADISAGGKRMRGFLVYLGYLVGGRLSHKASDDKLGILRILPIALAVELIHTFLLIHDDIIDKSDIRRGKVSIHRRYEKKFGEHYGISQGIVIGDIALFEAIDLINKSDLGIDEKVLCAGIINKVVLETVYGEALDVENSYKAVNVDDINLVTDLKTARYSFVGPLTLGAKLAGASNRQLVALESFGISMGFAFQLQDDVLGVFGDEKILGKSVLSDMREGKNTLLIYKTRELANKKDKGLIDKIWGDAKSDRKELTETRKIMKSTGAYDWCLGEMRRLKVKSTLNLNRITVDATTARIFAQLAEFIVSRRV